MQVETSVGQVPTRIGSWNPDRTPGMETSSTSSLAIKELTRLVWPEAIAAPSRTCLVGTWGYISLIPLRAISMSIPDLYILAKYQPQISLGSPILGPGWYESFLESNPRLVWSSWKESIPVPAGMFKSWYPPQQPVEKLESLMEQIVHRW